MMGSGNQERPVLLYEKAMFLTYCVWILIFLVAGLSENKYHLDQTQQFFQYNQIDTDTTTTSEPEENQRINGKDANLLNTDQTSREEVTDEKGRGNKSRNKKETPLWWNKNQSVSNRKQYEECPAFMRLKADSYSFRMLLTLTVLISGSMLHFSTLTQKNYYLIPVHIAALCLMIVHAIILSDWVYYWGILDVSFMIFCSFSIFFHFYLTMKLFSAASKIRVYELG